MQPGGDGMDGQRFDELTKALARGSSRRRVLRGLAGGLVAAVAGAVAGTTQEGAAAPPANKCGKLTCAAGETCLKGPGGAQCCPSAQVCGKTCLAASCQAPCQVCDPASGTCVAAANGTLCDADNDLCTVGDSCQNGVCVAGAPVVCPGTQVCRGGSCVCPNSCTSPQVLNTATCACECPPTSCPEGQTLDPVTCTCGGGVQCINTCSPNGNEGSHCDQTTGLCTCDEGFVVCPGGGASNGSEFQCCPPEYTCCGRFCAAAGGGVFDGCCPPGVPCGSPTCINPFPGTC